MSQKRSKPLLNRKETQSLLTTLKLATTAGALSLTIAGWGLLAQLDSAQAAANQPVTAAISSNSVSTGAVASTGAKALMACGYDRSFENITEKADRDTGSTPTASSLNPAQIKLNRVEQTITLPPGVGLDLGGIAKGWTVQQAAQRLGQLGPALVGAGGDIVCVGSPPSASSWPVGLSDLLQPETDLAAVTLRNEAVATSSLARRRWRHRGTLAHHLIDPRTGAPAETDLVSVTVIGPTLPAAEIHAKVALILGTEKGLAYLSTQPDVSALLVATDGCQLTYGTFEEKAYVYSHKFADTFVTLV